MRWLIGIATTVLLAGPTMAAGPDYLAQLLKGKTEEAPRRCIFPGLSARPVVIDRTAIVYRDARYTYVAHFKGGCSILRESRRIVTRGSTGGRLCANDPVHVSEETGGDIGFCTFDSFTPYKNAK